MTAGTLGRVRQLGCARRAPVPHVVRVHGPYVQHPWARAGAGFYVDATEDRWSPNYRMYTYVTAELPALIAEELPVDVTNASVTGHSMGGHGALIVGLKNPVRCCKLARACARRGRSG